MYLFLGLKWRDTLTWNSPFFRWMSSVITGQFLRWPELPRPAMSFDGLRGWASGGPDAYAVIGATLGADEMGSWRPLLRCSSYRGRTRATSSRALLFLLGRQVPQHTVYWGHLELRVVIYLHDARSIFNTRANIRSYVHTVFHFVKWAQSPSQPTTL